ncbi:MAG: flagellar motor switch protein FliN [Candidatus Thiodiazotropha sp. 'RUGA']|nr:flagellar motor switch protein FliN [Candidatus Thiodiazotropha sp. 'RUGA']
MSDEKTVDPNEALADEWAAALEDQADGEQSTATEAASFDELTDEAVSTGSVNMDAILDVPVTISMEIGRTKINIRNLLQLNQGSVVELDRLAGEPMDVLVNGTLIAQGEVVVVNEKFGLRLTDIISPSERVKRLS